LVVAGHIHSGYGRYQIGETIFVNAAFVNEQYIPSHEPIVVEL
jgi:Icc-related predicted phosphoesterase